jgi:hypothetical protein
MKYAFIVLIALYLIVYGCSSDETKTEPATHEKMEHSSAKQPQQPAQAAPEQAVEAPPAETAAVQRVEPQTAPPVVEEQPTEAENVISGQEQPLAQGVEEQAEMQVNPEDTVVMPCGRVFLKKDIPCDMPCPAFRQQEEPIAREESQPQEAPAASEDELTAAMHKMVEATNDMVLVTRQMVIATEQMIKATKGAAGEVINTGREIMQSEDAGKAAGQAVETDAAPEAQAVSPQQDVVKSMKEVVTAAREVIEVTNEAISKALEAKQE